MKKNKKYNTYIPGILDSFKFMGESHEEYDIPKTSYDKLFGDYTISNNLEDSMNIIEERNRYYLEMIYGKDKHKDIIDYLVKEITPTFRYHGSPYDGWRLELSGRNVLYNIYKYLGIDEIPNVYNTSKHIEKVALEEDSSKILTDFLNNNELPEEKKEFIKDTISNINKITNINDTSLDDKLRGRYDYKDLLFTVGFVSLDNYKKTGNALYLNFARKFYKMVTKPNKPLEWPHWINVNGQVYKDYEVFKKEYKEVMKNITTKKEENQKASIRFGDIFIKAGNLEDEIKSTDKLIEAAEKDTEVDEEYKRKELESLRDLRAKQEFYKGLGATRMIYGKEELFGYMGFEFDNGVRLFDKFYTGTRMIKPARNNAIYWFRQELEDMVFESKQDILKYIKSGDSDKVGRIIHDKNGKYKDKILKIIKEDKKDKE